MQCPKCQSEMEQVTYGRSLTVDRCTGCKGLWFDVGEAQQLRSKWMSEFLDSGDPDVGRQYNRIDDVNCPHCGQPMDKLADPDQRHIWYEACADHGMFFDAGEFTDYKYETVLDRFRSLLARKRS